MRLYIQIAALLIACASATFGIWSKTDVGTVLVTTKDGVTGVGNPKVWDVALANCRPTRIRSHCCFYKGSP